MSSDTKKFIDVLIRGLKCEYTKEQLEEIRFAMSDYAVAVILDSRVEKEARNIMRDNKDAV